MASPDRIASAQPLSHAECRRRLRAIIDGSAHLRPTLPLDSPHNAVLRISDVARYIQRHEQILRRFLTETRPKKCSHNCHHVDACPRKPRCLEYPADMQAVLGRMFLALERGTLAKQRIGDEWRIAGTHHGALSQVVPAPQSPAAARKPHECRINLTAVGPKLRVR